MEMQTTTISKTQTKVLVAVLVLLAAGGLAFGFLPLAKKYSLDSKAATSQQLGTVNKCGVNTYKVGAKCKGGFSSAYVQCYSGTEFTMNEGCQTGTFYEQRGDELCQRECSAPIEEPVGELHITAVQPEGTSRFEYLPTNASTQILEVTLEANGEDMVVESIPLVFRTTLSRSGVHIDEHPIHLLTDVYIAADPAGEERLGSGSVEVDRDGAYAQALIEFDRGFRVEDGDVESLYVFANVDSYARHQYSLGRSLQGNSFSFSVFLKGSGLQNDPVDEGSANYQFDIVGLDSGQEIDPDVSGLQGPSYVITAAWPTIRMTNEGFPRPLVAGFQTIMTADVNFESEEVLQNEPRHIDPQLLGFTFGIDRFGIEHVEDVEICLYGYCFAAEQESESDQNGLIRTYYRANSTTTIGGEYSYPAELEIKALLRGLDEGSVRGNFRLSDFRYSYDSADGLIHSYFTGISASDAFGSQEDNGVFTSDWLHQ